MRGELGVECADHGGDGLGPRGEGEVAAAEEEQPQGQVEGHVRAVGHGGVLGADAAPQVSGRRGEVVEFEYELSSVIIRCCKWICHANV